MRVVGQGLPHVSPSQFDVSTGKGTQHYKKMPRPPRQVLAHLALYNLHAGATEPSGPDFAHDQLACLCPRSHGWTAGNRTHRWPSFPGSPGCCQYPFPSHQSPFLIPRPPVEPRNVTSRQSGPRLHHMPCTGPWKAAAQMGEACYD